MRSLLFALSTAVLLVAPWASAAEDPKEKPAEEKTESGLPKVVGALGKSEKGGKPAADKTPVDERIAKILAGLEPKAAAKTDPMKPVAPVDPAARVLVLFQQLDQDESGTLSWSEFRVLAQFGGNPEKLREVFNHLDTNNDERINGQEARQGVEYLTNVMNGKPGNGNGNNNNNNNGGNNPLNQAIMAQTQAIFVQLDSNGDGKISEREARKDPQAAQAFALGDTNQDKELTREEVYNYFLRQAQAAQPPGFVPGKLGGKK